MAIDIGQSLGRCTVCGEIVVVTHKGAIRHDDCPGGGQPPADWVTSAADFQAVAEDLMDALADAGVDVSANVANRSIQMEAYDDEAVRLLKLLKRRKRRAFWRGVGSVIDLRGHR